MRFVQHRRQAHTIFLERLQLHLARLIMAECHEFDKQDKAERTYCRVRGIDPLRADIPAFRASGPPQPVQM